MTVDSGSSFEETEKYYISYEVFQIHWEIYFDFIFHLFCNIVCWLLFLRVQKTMTRGSVWHVQYSDDLWISCYFRIYLYICIYTRIYVQMICPPWILWIIPFWLFFFHIFNNSCLFGFYFFFHVFALIFMFFFFGWQRN